MYVQRDENGKICNALKWLTSEQEASGEWEKVSYDDAELKQFLAEEDV